MSRMREGFVRVVKRWQPRVGRCVSSRKVSHWSRASAEAAALRSEWVDGVRLYVYVCPSCNFYHLTKTPQ